MKKKRKNRLNLALEKAAKVIEKHFVSPTPTIDDAKQILRDLRKIAKKPSRSRGNRRKVARRLKRK